MTNVETAPSAPKTWQAHPESDHILQNTGAQKTNAHFPKSVKIDTDPSERDGIDILTPDAQRTAEHFLPITRAALMDRLTNPNVWNEEDSRSVRRFFRYLDYWRHQNYAAKIIELEQSYEPFSPDTDLLLTRKYTDAELSQMQQRILTDVEEILVQANYKRIDPTVISELLTRETHYGLDLEVDFNLFDECLIYYRGASTRKDTRRALRKFGLKEEFDVPIFQRLFLLFKIKPIENRILEIIEAEDLPRKKATQKAKKERAHLPTGLSEDNIYMKLFKNIPRTDVEMIFPNTKVKFRMFDKVKLGITGAGGLGVTGFSVAGKIAALSNPFTAVPVIGGVGAALFRQVMNFSNTKQRYMVIMAQNLYFHSMADNRSVINLLADRAADEDVKEEMLLYAVLAKEKARKDELEEIDKAIEGYIKNEFGIEVDFDVDDAMQRLVADGIVSESPDGFLVTRSPADAAEHLDSMWDVFLDNLPDVGPTEGYEAAADGSSVQS